MPLMLRLLVSAALLIAPFASTALAQVVVVDESQAPEGQVVERGYVRGEGRGIQYGAHLVSPVYVMPVLAPDETPVGVDAGLGVRARIGWEFPSGFTLEVQGGFAANAIPNATLEMSNVFTRAEVGGAARYMFFNETAFVPFIEVGGAFRWFFFDWMPAGGRRVNSSGDGESLTGAVTGAVGAQIELSPFFGIELGCAVDYTFAGGVFADGFVAITPFVGVTLYVYDESGY